MFAAAPLPYPVHIPGESHSLNHTLDCQDRQWPGSPDIKRCKWPTASDAHHVNRQHGKIGKASMERHSQPPTPQTKKTLNQTVLLLSEIKLNLPRCFTRPVCTSTDKRNCVYWGCCSRGASWNSRGESELNILLVGLAWLKFQRHCFAKSLVFYLEVRIFP